MTEIFQFSPEDVYLKINQFRDMDHMLKKKDREPTSKLINFIFDTFDNQELYLGGSVLKNQIYGLNKKYNDINLLVVSPDDFSHNFLQTKEKHKLENLLNINQNMPYLQAEDLSEGSSLRYKLHNEKRTDFDVHFDYKKQDIEGKVNFEINGYR